MPLTDSSGRSPGAAMVRMRSSKAGTRPALIIRASPELAGHRDHVPVSPRLAPRKVCNQTVPTTYAPISMSAWDQSCMIASRCTFMHLNITDSSCARQMPKLAPASPSTDTSSSRIESAVPADRKIEVSSRSSPTSVTRVLKLVPTPMWSRAATPKSLPTRFACQR